jgi:NAD(P)-dependent dehydrogenase (short-subunit alcohol dehydrogenase family)
VGKAVTRRAVLGGGAAGAAAVLAAPSASAEAKGRFDGKVVLITGATSGIGRETALAFAAQGARVGFCGRRAELGREVERELRGRGFYVKADVREPAQVESFVDEVVVRRYGKLDIAFNNAGIHLAKPVHETSLAEWEDVQRTNARGVFLAIKHEIPNLLRNGGIPDDQWAKFKQAWGPLNVHGLPRMAEPEEIAGAVLALASPDFSYLTGASVVVDGGLGTGRPMTMPSLG